MQTGWDAAAKAKKWKGEKAWLGILLAGMMLGTLAFGYITVFGHTHEFRIPWQPAWGLLVTSFEFFILCGAGLALVSGWACFAGGDRFRGLLRRLAALAVLAIVIGTGLVIIELTQPTRLSMASVLGPAFYRALFLDLLWFALAVGALLALLRRLRRRGTAAPAALGTVASLLGLAGIYQMGEVLHQFGHPPEWLAPPGIVDYLLAALVSGTAIGVLLLFLNSKFSGSHSAVVHPSMFRALRHWLMILLALYGVWMLLVTAGPFLLTGPLAFNFWGLQVVVGVFLPFLLLLGRAAVRVEWRAAAAAGFVLAGQFFRSYDMIIAKQLGTFYAESSFLVDHGLLAMAPCLPKTSVVIGAICLFLFLMSINEKMIPWNEGSQRGEH